jgi:hypothetical protein
MKYMIPDQTITVPRQLVSVRVGLDPALTEKVREILTGLYQTNGSQELYEGLDETEKFDAWPSDAAEELQELKELMKLVSL